MPIVGLTGGIAAGKSTISHEFMKLGVPVVDADQVSRAVVQPGSPGLQAVVDAFGSEYLTADGHMDRKKVGNLVFNDPAARKKLGLTLHPFIHEKAQAWLTALAATSPYVIYENAILVDLGLHKNYDALVVVTADQDVRRARLMARNSLTEAEADARLSAQIPEAERIREADYVIDNGNDVGAITMSNRVLRVHRELTARFQTV